VIAHAALPITERFQDDNLLCVTADNDGGVVTAEHSNPSEHAIEEADRRTEKGSGVFEPKVTKVSRPFFRLRKSGDFEA